MISLLQAKDFRCLRYISQPLEPFQVLVGPNASGKTTFLDIVSFLGMLVNEGLDAAIAERTENFQDLTWGRSGESIDLALEARFPDEIRARLRDPRLGIVRYEVRIGIDNESRETQLLAETVVLKADTAPENGRLEQREFPIIRSIPETLLEGTHRKGSQTVVNKVRDRNDNFYSEVYHEKGKGWAPSYKLGPRKSALGNLPEDESKFPVSTWLKQFLSEGIQKLVLNSLLIRRASPPGQGRGFKPDGSNVPWVLDTLTNVSKSNWIQHLATALPDLEDVRIVDRQDDRHRYLMLKYRGGLEVPSWMASDGTLRLLALTLPAYLPKLTGVFLIEEPENGIHPRAAETVFQSLSSVYGAQVLLATHSPVIVSMAEPEQVLCFAKTPDGATDIVRGDEHPALRAWQRDTSLGALFAGGVLS